jgi:hypothetical protein
MNVQDVDDIEKLAGTDFISPAGTISDAGLQSSTDVKAHIPRGMQILTRTGFFLERILTQSQTADRPCYNDLRSLGETTCVVREILKNSRSRLGHVGRLLPG